jgi:putative DNA primase/helicase
MTQTPATPDTSNTDPLDRLAEQPPKATIRVIPGEMHVAWRELMAAMIERGCDIYVRGGHLVRPLWRLEMAQEYAEIDDGRRVLALSIDPLDALQLADTATRQAATFAKYDARASNANKWKKVDPPMRLIETLLGANMWDFHSLRGVISVPTMRPDGSIIDREGYDPRTQLYYKPSAHIVLPPIPEQPTRDDAKAALQIINDLLDGFPFANKKSRAVACAAIMSVVLRGAFLAVPIFLITAPEPRTGKTYLVQLTGVIGTGHNPVNTAGSKDPVEMEKRIETAGLTGRQILHFNNLPNGMSLESSSLAQIATEGWLEVRKLGILGGGIIDCRSTTVFINGNNITIAADLVDRCAFCRLNAKTAEPGLRRFTSNPIDTVHKNHGEVLAACFTIARAYHAAGSPPIDGLRAVAGFNGWSKFVQAPLMWLECADPLGNQKLARAMDRDRDEFRHIITVLRTVFNDRPTTFTVAQLKRLANDSNPDLRDIMSLKGHVNTRYFGRLLSRHADRIDNGWGISDAGVDQHVKVYELSCQNPAAQGQDRNESQQQATDTYNPDFADDVPF